MPRRLWAQAPVVLGRLRLLEHPRFRAAYDFLVLRASESDELAELAQWWTQAQSLNHEELAQQLAGLPTPPAAEPGATAPAKRKRPRRRRKRKSTGAAPATESSD